MTNGSPSTTPMKFFHALSTGKTIAIAAILAALGITVTIAQLPPEDGLSILQEAYAETSMPSHGEASRLSYAVRTVTIDGDDSIESNIDIDYVAAEDRFHWVSKEVELYSDGRIMVVVDNREKTIHISPCGKDYEQQRVAAMARMLPDSLFRFGKLLLWETMEEEGREGQEIVPDRHAILLPPDAMRASTLVDTIEVKLNARENKLQKVVLIYVPGCQVERVEAVYKAIEQIDRPSEFERPVKEMVFDDDGTLRKAYGGFDVVDMVAMRDEFGTIDE